MELWERFMTLPVQTRVYTVEGALYIVAVICAIFAASLINGTGFLLGKSYGKAGVARKGVGYILYTLFILSILGYCAVVIIDIIYNFFEYTPTTPLKKMVFLIISVALLFLIGFFAKSIVSKIRDAKYKKAIDDILMSNPVFVEALNRLKSDDTIKMLKVYRDGIAFYNYVSLPQNVDEKINFGATTNSEARKLVNGKKQETLGAEGSVLKSKSTNIIRYITYDYSDSESAMFDISKYLCQYLSPKFEKISYKKGWEYKEVFVSGPTGYIINNGVATSTGASSKTVFAYESVVLYEVLYIAPAEVKSVQRPTKQW